MVNSINAKSSTENTEWVFTLLFLIRIFYRPQRGRVHPSLDKKGEVFSWGASINLIRISQTAKLPHRILIV